MGVRPALHRRPIPFLTAVAFLVALTVTVAYFAGLVPGVRKTLSLFTRLATVTVVLLMVTVFAWLWAFVAG